MSKKPNFVPIMMVWNQSLYGGDGGFMISVRHGMLEGLRVYATTKVERNEHGDFLDIFYDIIEKPKLTTINWDAAVESLLKTYMCRGIIAAGDPRPIAYPASSTPAVVVTNSSNNTVA